MHGNQQKNIVRTKLNKVRHNLNPEQVESNSQTICSLISELSVFKTAKKVGIYLPFSNEVSLLPLLSFDNKQFFVPVLQKDLSLQFFSYQLGDATHLNLFKITEPSLQKTAIDINQLEIILIPLLGFSKNGQRLGMGQGCYDRTLENTKNPLLIGVAHSLQQIDSLENEAHDINLDCIITEKQIFYTSSRIQKLID